MRYKMRNTRQTKRRRNDCPSIPSFLEDVHDKHGRSGTKEGEKERNGDKRNIRVLLLLTYMKEVGVSEEQEHRSMRVMWGENGDVSV